MNILELETYLTKTLINNIQENRKKF